MFQKYSIFWNVWRSRSPTKDISGWGSLPFMLVNDHCNISFWSEQYFFLVFTFVTHNFYSIIFHIPILNITQGYLYGTVFLFNGDSPMSTKLVSQNSVSKKLTFSRLRPLDPLIFKFIRNIFSDFEYFDNLTLVFLCSAILNFFVFF